MNRFSTYNIIRTIALMTALLIFIPEISAQSYTPTPVTISKEKVRIDGKICYSHIVLERQTLYSISKAYGVSVEDIYMFNPTLKETGLKKNGIILIPSEQAIQKKSSEENNTISTASQDSISLEQAPESSTQVPVTTKEVKKQKRKTHTVKWYEDLDVIAEKYEISVKDLMEFNNLTSRKLTSRQKLQIPTPADIDLMKSSEEISEDTELKEVVTDKSIEEVQDSILTDEKPLAGTEIFSRKEEINAALLLPLKATGTTSHRGNMDFYCGVLLAISDLSDKGISTDLKVCDIADNGLPPYSYLKDRDFVIGPISSGILTDALEMGENSLMFISPLDQRAHKLVSSYENMIQVPTPHSIQYRNLVDWVLEDKKETDKIIFISEKGARKTEVQMEMTAAIDSSHISYRNFSYSILEGRDIMDPLMALMTPSGTNRVIIASESEAFVNDVVRNLNLIKYQKYDVVLYAPAKTRNFETIDVENIHNTSLHASLGYFINYDDAKVKKFLMKYRAIYNTEPTQFAYQGYDIATYFISIVNKYGEAWTEMLENEKMEMLQSTFEFKKQGNGYANTGIKRIVYEEGWTIKQID